MRLVLPRFAHDGEVCSSHATRKLFLVAAIGFAGCSNAASAPAQITAIVESQDNIVSEDGVLALASGTLSVQSISLVGPREPVPLVGRVSLDLSAHSQRLALLSDVPAGEYTGLAIELAPPNEGAETLDVVVQSLGDQTSVRATSRLEMSGSVEFTEGVRAIADGSEVELRLFLRGMFFYLYPLSDAVDGRYVAGEPDRGFLTMDLVGLFDLRVSDLP